MGSVFLGPDGQVTNDQRLDLLTVHHSLHRGRVA